MATGTIPTTNATYVSASSATAEQIKKATVAIAYYKTSDNTTMSTVALIPEQSTKGLSAVWNGQRWFYSFVSIWWSKANGTISLKDSYTERPNATVSLVGYFLIF